MISEQPTGSIRTVDTQHFGTEVLIFHVSYIGSFEKLFYLNRVLDQASLKKFFVSDYISA